LWLAHQAECDYRCINIDKWFARYVTGEGSGITLTADSTTAQLACCNRGVTLSTMFSASRASAALYLERASNIKT